MASPGSTQDEDLARRVYAYFVFRLRQPDEAEHLTRLSFERFWRQTKLSRDAEQEPDVPVFAAARAVMAENPRRRGATRVARPREWEGAATRLGDELALAIGRLHGRERDALALRFGGELSVGEIAELLGLTPADVKQRLARGIRGLRDLGVMPKEDEAASSAERPRAGGSKESQPEQREAEE